VRIRKWSFSKTMGISKSAGMNDLVPGKVETDSFTR